MAEDQYDWWSNIPGAAKSALVGGLLLAAAGNLGVVSTFQRTDDRFRGEDFKREIAVRDEVIAENRRDIARLEQHIEQSDRDRESHERHSAKYTEIINQLVRALDAHMEREHGL